MNNNLRTFIIKNLKIHMRKLYSNKIVSHYKFIKVYNRYSPRDIFYSFLESHRNQINYFLKTAKYEKLFLFKNIIFFQKSDIEILKFKNKFFKHCNRNKICIEHNMYIHIDYLSYYTPSICGFDDIEHLNDYIDINCIHPDPSFIIETINIKDTLYYNTIKTIYYLIKQLYRDSIILLIDPLNKKVLELNIDIKENVNINELNYSDNFMLNGVIFNFENEVFKK
ncbi:hypothetical protein TCON_0498 [Astathelohania contejeani]|uniref:Restriction endonuclease domain-containing protein n=1 Tax=Astathelohania contejeani TaxID=164912 RepID=A0ABQ7I1M4_9MICR|nr:hypothetical protein TCON_0498 [Thelohania contejeani]